MKRWPYKSVMTPAVAGLGIAALALAVHVSIAGSSSANAAKMSDGTEPVPALTPYVEAHTHFDDKNIEATVQTALAALGTQNAAMVFYQMPPDVFGHPGRYDAEVLLPAVKMHPGKLAVLGGGGTLNPMIIQAAATGDAGPEVQKKFKERAEELLREGVVGFGEMTAEHFDGATPYSYAPPDHPLYLLLADIAAQHGVPIDIHMEAVPQDMPLPAGLKSPPNAPQLHENLMEFERLLAHNPRAKIIWAHAGADNTGFRTVELNRRLLRAHSNLYMEIKTDPQAQGLNYPLGADGKIKADWFKLFTDFPDRFIIGSDQHYPQPKGQGQRWQEAVLLLNQLPPDVRKKIGTENVAHIYGHSIATYLRAAKN